MRAPRLLVVAKAPVPGRVKTRLGADVGMVAAAELAAAALADTVAACSAAYGPGRCCLALEGDVEAGVDGEALTRLLEGWTSFPQRGDGLASRLVNAHADAGSLAPGPVIQVGMDTPHLTPDLLVTVGDDLGSNDAVLGPAADGGWWVLGVRDPLAVGAIAEVPMSAPTTGRDTRRALEAAGLRVAATTTLRDVDTVADAEHVASLIPTSRFGLAWTRLRAGS